MILPVEVFGRSATKRTERGSLQAAKCGRQKSISSASVMERGRICPSIAGQRRETDAIDRFEPHDGAGPYPSTSEGGLCGEG